MGKKEKLLKKLTSNPKDFTFEEVESLLLGSCGFQHSNKGKTSGSRVEFYNPYTGTDIIIHRPHPRKELLHYQVKNLINDLKQEGIL